MNELLAIGFECVGHWVLENDQLTIKLLKHERAKNVLYAFVSNGDVKYIGKTIQSLSRRMYGYQRPSKSQSTNCKNNTNIKELISAGEAVDIFVLPDDGLLHYGNFHLNLAAGLEDSLIRNLAPPWNGSTAPDSSDMPASPSETEIVVNTAGGIKHTFTFVLQPTYFKSGFFNVSVSDEKYFAGDGEEIEIILADSSCSVNGYINRSANTNLTPRIMGGVALRNWFQDNCIEKQNVLVYLNSPVSITLRSEKNR